MVGVRMKQVSIIMATYNGARYVTEQVESILRSEYQRFVIHIFDDCSTDGTFDIINGYKDKYPEKVRVYRNERNLGCVRNFLGGLRMVAKADGDSTQGTYYMFCDQDDVWLPQKIGKMVKMMEQMEARHGHESPLLLFSDAFVDGHKSYLRRQGLNPKKTDIAHILVENKCSGCMMAFNTPLAKKVDVIPKYARYHDWWLALIASSLGHIEYLPTPLITYRQHDGNMVGSQDMAEYLRDRMSNIHYQKLRIHANQLQAEEFMDIYRGELSGDHMAIIEIFAHLSGYPWLKRRMMALGHGYLKSSFIRNIGLLFLL